MGLVGTVLLESPIEVAAKNYHVVLAIDSLYQTIKLQVELVCLRCRVSRSWCVDLEDSYSCVVDEEAQKENCFEFALFIRSDTKNPTLYFEGSGSQLEVRRALLLPEGS